MGYLARAQKPRIYIELVKFCTVMVFPDIKESRPDEVYFTTTVYLASFFLLLPFFIIKKKEASESYHQNTRYKKGKKERKNWHSPTESWGRSRPRLTADRPVPLLRGIIFFLRENTTLCIFSYVQQEVNKSWLSSGAHYTHTRVIRVQCQCWDWNPPVQLRGNTCAPCVSARAFVWHGPPAAEGQLFLLCSTLYCRHDEHK